MEAVKTRPVWWRVSGAGAYLNNADTALSWIDKWARSADGTFTTPDCVRSGSGPHVPTSGVETCSVVEEMYSLRTAYEITGSVSLFDRLEFVAFNAMPATTWPDFSGNAYYHSVNQIDAHGKTGFGGNGCCTANVHQGWPKFIMSGVQTFPDNRTIVVSGYSPHTATLKDGTTVTVDGQYPFADTATITISRPSQPQEAWALALRIPCWVDSAHVHVPGGDPLPAAPCTHFHVPGLSETTQNGSPKGSRATITVSVTFAHSIKVVSGKWDNGAVEINRGPLLFTFAIPGKVNRSSIDPNGTAMMTTSVVLDDSAPWQIALKDPSASLAFEGFTAVAGVPFDHASPPATIKGQARQVAGYRKALPPASPVQAKDFNGTLFDIKLIPLAHSHLRLTVLPVLADDGGQEGGAAAK